MRTKAFHRVALAAAATAVLVAFSVPSARPGSTADRPQTPSATAPVAPTTPGAAAPIAPPLLAVATPTAATPSVVNELPDAHPGVPAGLDGRTDLPPPPWCARSGAR